MQRRHFVTLPWAGTIAGSIGRREPRVSIYASFVWSIQERGLTVGTERLASRNSSSYYTNSKIITFWCLMHVNRTQIVNNCCRCLTSIIGSLQTPGNNVLKSNEPERPIVEKVKWLPLDQTLSTFHAVLVTFIRSFKGPKSRFCTFATRPFSSGRQTGSVMARVGEWI